MAELNVLAGKIVDDIFLSELVKGGKLLTFELLESRSLSITIFDAVACANYVLKLVLAYDTG